MEGRNACLPAPVKGSGADQAEQFMEAKRTPFTGGAGHRRTMRRQGQSKF
jgi:hypothetical protein